MCRLPARPSRSASSAGLRSRKPFTPSWTASRSTAARCQLIYFATDRDAEIRQAIQTIKTAHTLTIGEHDRFLDYGGAVGLLQVDGHMGFEVSLEALERSGIEISSKLLRLGQIKRKHEQ